jgi:hypothetical protein
VKNVTGITPKNWHSFQHYKDRNPTWIKLHKSLLDDYKFARLPLSSRALAPCLWLLASEYAGGKIDASPSEIAFRLRIEESELIAALKPLIDEGFFIADSATLAISYQPSIPEKEKEAEIEEETEKEAIRSPRVKRVSNASTVLFELQRVLDAEHALAVIEYRKSLKRPLTTHAAKLLAKKLAQAPDANIAADTMIERGWRGYDVTWKGAVSGSAAGGVEYIMGQRIEG